MKKIFVLWIMIILFGCGKGDDQVSQTKNWTLVATNKEKTIRWYVDMESIALKSPGIYSYKELFDTDIPEEVARGDARKVKSIVTNKLVDCRNGTTKQGSYTAYVDNMGRGGLKIDGESTLTIWMGTLPDTPSRDQVLALCRSS